MKQIILNNAGSSTIPDLSHNAFYSINAYFPKSLTEQLKIGKYLDSLDNLITLHQHKLDKLKEVKSALLDKLLV